MFIETPAANPETPPTVESPGRYHELAEAMRRGCQMGRKCFGAMFDLRFDANPTGMIDSCALGAAALGIGFNPEVWHEKSVHLLAFFDLAKKFPELRHVYGPVSVTLGDKIIEMNDARMMSREEIADWLDTL